MKELEQALFAAAERGDIAAIELLLAQGVPVNTKNHYNETALIIAARTKNPILEKKLLERHDIELHTQGYLTGTALTFVIFSDQTDLEMVLLDKESHFRNEEHPGTVNWAVLNENKVILKLLIQKGANIDSPGLVGLDVSPDWVWKPEPDSEITPFHREYFPQLKYTPLCLSIYSANHNMIEFLLKECQADPNQPNDNGALPLQIAAERNDGTAVKLLLKYGAKPVLRENYDENPEIPSHLRGRKLEINQNIKTIIEAAKREKASQKAVTTINMHKSTTSSVIPEALLEPYKDAFNIAYIEFSEAMISETDRKILSKILQEDGISTTQLIIIAREYMFLPRSVATSLCTLYCGLHPIKWGEIPKEFEHIKEKLINHTVTLCSSSQRITGSVLPAPPLVLKKIGSYDTETELKKLAQEFCNGLFNGNIQLNQEEIILKQNLLSRLSQQTPPASPMETSPPSSPRGLLETYIETYGQEFVAQNEPKNVTEEKTSTSNTQPSTSSSFALELPKDSSTLLSPSSKEWREIYELIKLPETYKRQRNPNQMFNIVKAILHKIETGCTWKTAQADVDSGSVYYYFTCWERDGTLKKIFEIAARLATNKAGTFQIVYYGQKDIVLTGNPSRVYFEVVYPREKPGSSSSSVLLTSK
jgi:ankyrin repeat protein/transposase